MYVHAKCLQQEIDAKPSVFCSVCQTKYNLVETAAWDTTGFAWLCTVLILIIDECVVVYTTKPPWLVAALFLALDLIYGIYLCKHITSRCRCVYVITT